MVGWNRVMPLDVWAAFFFELPQGWRRKTWSEILSVKAMLRQLTPAMLSFRVAEHRTMRMVLTMRAVLCEILQEASSRFQIECGCAR